MKKFRMEHAWVIALLLGVVGACRPGPVKPGPRIVQINQPFWLQMSQSAVLQAEPLELTLLRVEEDSRCPAGVVCIWAGEVILVMGARDGASRAELTFRVGPAGDTKTFEDYVIRVLEVAPPAGPPGTTIRQQEYRALVVVQEIIP